MFQKLGDTPHFKKRRAQFSAGTKIGVIKENAENFAEHLLGTIDNEIWDELNANGITDLSFKDEDEKQEAFEDFIIAVKKTLKRML